MTFSCSSLKQLFVFRLAAWGTSLPKLLFCLLAFGVTALAQEPSGVLPSIKDNYPQTWREFATRTGGFKVKLPGLPEKERREQIVGGQKITLSLLSYGAASPIQYSITYGDYPQDLTTPEAVKSFLEAARDRGLSAARRTGTKNLSESEITVDGAPGKLLKFDPASNQTLRVKLILAGQRLYEVMVITPKEEAKVPEGGSSYEQIALSFLDSFHLLQPVPKR